MNMSIWVLVHSSVHTHLFIFTTCLLCSFTVTKCRLSCLPSFYTGFKREMLASSMWPICVNFSHEVVLMCHTPVPTNSLLWISPSALLRHWAWCVLEEWVWRETWRLPGWKVHDDVFTSLVCLTVNPKPNNNPFIITQDKEFGIDLSN